MFRVDAIHPVSDFSRKPSEYIARLKATKNPEILTVNGKAELVIQDAEAYQEMVDLLDSLEKISAAAKRFDAGEGNDINIAFQNIRSRLKAKYSDADF
jgi:prevent-host-death family protein